ncbi:MAG TPA: DUF4340 domain-containing protein [Kiritimatiellia bacterium]|nr:DUF4340 domain-containing protein [Kiritimatiellia bacterium]
MKPRTLLILIALVAVLGVLALWLARRPEAIPPPEAGQRLLTIPDVNTLTRVEISSGTQQVTLVRTGDDWAVETLWNFPARFSQLADLLRGMDNLRVAEVLRGGTSVLGEFGLVDDSTNFPARVKLYGPDGRLSDDVLFGNPRTAAAMPNTFSPPDSRYARAGRGPVVLVEPFLTDIRRRPSDWIETALFDLRPDAITMMTAVPSNDAMYAISRAPDGALTGINILQDKPINGASADIWFRAFRAITAVTVVDPAIPHETLGRAEAEVAIARASNGLIARVELGAQADDASARYAWMTFDYEEPDPLQTDDAEAASADAALRNATRNEVERLQREVSPWTFVFSFSQAQKFIFLRDQLIAAQSERTPAPEADAPPGND